MSALVNLGAATCHARQSGVLRKTSVRGVKRLMRFLRLNANSAAKATITMVDEPSYNTRSCIPVSLSLTPNVESIQSLESNLLSLPCNNCHTLPLGRHQCRTRLWPARRLPLLPLASFFSPCGCALSAASKYLPAGRAEVSAPSVSPGGGRLRCEAGRDRFVADSEAYCERV